MNVSMMDSYNLSWKLVHSLHGLTPKPTHSGGNNVLATFGEERVSVARQLIEFDSKFSSMFSGQIGMADPQLNNLTHDLFLKVFSDGSGFTSGCGIEYGKSVLVDNCHHSNPENPVVGHDYLQGTLMPGRRLVNVRVRRYADGNPRDLHDGESQYLDPTQTNIISRFPLHGAIPHPCSCQQRPSPFNWIFSHGLAAVVRSGHSVFPFRHCRAGCHLPYQDWKV